MAIQSLFRVAIILGGRVEYEREVLRGIREFAASSGDWLVRLEPPSDDTVAFLREWKPEGILYQAADLTDEALQAVGRFGQRAIHLSDIMVGQAGTSFVGMNNAAIGLMAAEHLLQSARNSYAFVGVRDSGFSERRGNAFCARVKSAGIQPRSFFMNEWLFRRKDEERVIRFLQRLPKPCALFATHDECALWLSTLCRSRGIRVPVEVAILGVDNDELICEIAWPTISSVAVPSRQVGVEASVLLDEAMREQNREPVSKLLLPDRIVTRESTSASDTDDETVNRAIAFVRQHLARSINVNDVARGVGVSRRLLERKFRQSLGRSPLQELQRQRVDRAKTLLRHPDTTLTEVASLCGCADASQLIVRFRRETGMTPGEFRNCVAITEA